MVLFQKLTRNLFLTLHGHNAHCQQQQLSKFLMRYQQFAFHASHGLEKMHDASFLNRAQNSCCILMTDLDTSEWSTQKAFSCCNAILETGPAVSMRGKLLVAHEKLGQLPLLTVYVVPV